VSRSITNEDLYDMAYVYRAPRKRNWDDDALAWDTATGEFDVEGTVENRRGMREGGAPESVIYTPPKKDQKWRARDLFDIHYNIIAKSIGCPYPSLNAIMSGLISHANPKTGRCSVGYETLGIETGYHRNTVAKVLQWAAEFTPFLRKEKRGTGRSYAYHPQWDAMEEVWSNVQVHIARRKEERRRS
jgi:hypothetical protein